ncbi:CARDB domain-containing protein [Faucicola mancuniensis]|uniref:CARDB domain-containing protein n=1 Tax=Faucicola mancuniensis TaxID=1309795 RepID=UPI003977DCF9
MFVITDASVDSDGKVKIKKEFNNTSPTNRNDEGLSHFGGKNFGSPYTGSVYEGLLNSNNSKRSELNITYREPDLVFEDIKLSNPTPKAGEEITVTWTVKNQGTRETRSGFWLDGLYLSKDDALDRTDFALVDRGSEIERNTRTRVTTVSSVDSDKTVHLKPGESYTNTATFRLPTNIGGDYKLILKTDTEFLNDSEHYGITSTIRPDLNTIKVKISTMCWNLLMKAIMSKSSICPLPMSRPRIYKWSASWPTRVSLPVNNLTFNTGWSTKAAMCQVISMVGLIRSTYQKTAF